MDNSSKERRQLARDYFEQGYNCCTSVVLANADEINLDQDTILKLTSSFGGGMGRLKEVCGAISGIFMVAGLKYGYTAPGVTDEKADHYKMLQKMAGQFKNKNGSLLCRDLLDEEKCPHHECCAGYIEDAIEILEEELKQKQK
ncbi:MAG: C-GCAxxG-C-C family protein [Eubacteriales bacterium]